MQAARRDRWSVTTYLPEMAGGLVTVTMLDTELKRLWMPPSTPPPRWGI